MEHTECIWCIGHTHRAYITQRVYTVSVFTQSGI
uniref:Uncharacterized protein n=1 Tax=Anguilla anguilla TaxID=7936 RepID=A0A0E9U001_ANGAN